MRKTLIAVLAIASVPVVPAIASASVVDTVRYQYNQQIRQNVRLIGNGFHFVSTSLRCAYRGGGNYACVGTYIVTNSGTHYKYMQFIKITPYRWFASGGGTLVSTW